MFDPAQLSATLEAMRMMGLTGSVDGNDLPGMFKEMMMLASGRPDGDNVADTMRWEMERAKKLHEASHAHFHPLDNSDVLICRVMSASSLGGGISFFVEDTKGHVVPVTIMNPSPGHACYISGASLKELFPLGCVLAIREPYVRFAVNGNVAVRVDVPSDVIVLHHSHPTIQDLRWAYPPVAAFRPSTEQLKEAGNKAMARKDYMVSIVKYSIALTATIEHLPPALHLALLLNRAQAYLFNGKPGSAYRDCLAARIFMDEHPDVVQPHHRERLAYRSAQAAYDMRLYDRAGRFVQECNQLGVKQGALLEEMITARQREAKEGSYNWETMFEASIEKNAPFLDVADYTGSVTVARIPAKGRGLITTQDVKAGELLLVSKALVAAYQAETPGLTVINVDFEHNLMSKTSHVTAKVKAVHQLMDNIGLGKMFDSLQAGTSGSCHLSSPVVTEDQQLSALLQPYNVDPARLEGILNDNAFGFMQLSKQANTFHPERGNDTTDTPTRLFGLPSLMNHSCIPNTSSFSLGDLMVVRALHDLQKGTEITTSYFPGDEPAASRFDKSTKWSSKCDCQLCTDDAAEDHSRRAKMLLAEFAPLMDRSRQIFHSFSFPRSLVESELTREDIQRFARRLDETYGIRRLAPKPDTYQVWRVLSDHFSHCDVGSAIETEIKGLVSVGNEVASRAQRQAHGRTIQRLGQFGGDASVISMLLVSKMYHSIENKTDAVAWAKTAFWADEVLYGCGREVFLKRFGHFLDPFQRTIKWDGLTL
ncbi:hypothetical protein JCM24511_01387 [Saitozyma sp. JCM 24511]|nr:hypothetical protein JCM24511_01387 [Saitozyma sp. JCM 24511]